jgi:mannose-6-phosphate isomerase-like protein (cupin superfamily)
MEISEPMQQTNLSTLSQSITDQYKNFVVNYVNDSCIRLAVMKGVYPWHFHPTSDELFMVLEGELFIDFQDRDTVALKPHDIFTITAGVIHRTRATQRTVNICFEHSDATTEFLEGR